VIGLGGISLRVQVPASAVAELGRPGGEVRLYTHLYVREDNLALYGFLRPEELSLFELLLTVSGIGPRAALALLSALPPDRLRAAIGGEDIDTLCRVPGIGRKTAGRLVLELKGKLAASAAGSPGREPDSEVISALTALGYSTAEAQLAVSSIKPSPDATLEDRILLALRYFTQRS